jgi:hypothetical protein
MTTERVTCIPVTAPKVTDRGGVMAAPGHEETTMGNEFERFEINGRWFDRHVSGRVLPVLWGGAEGDPANPGQPDPAAVPVVTPPPAATLTQADADKLVKAAEARATAAAAKAHKDFLDGEKTKADQAAMTEVDRAKAEADTARAEAETIRSEARAERVAAKVERLLIGAGVPVVTATGAPDPATLARAVRAANVGPDATDEEIAAEVAQLKLDAPGLFTAAAAAAPPRQPSGHTGAVPPAGGQGTTTALERGAYRWRTKHPAKTA